MSNAMDMSNDERLAVLTEYIKEQEVPFRVWHVGHSPYTDVYELIMSPCRFRVAVNCYGLTVQKSDRYVCVQAHVVEAYNAMRAVVNSQVSEHDQRVSIVCSLLGKGGVYALNHVNAEGHQYEILVPDFAFRVCVIPEMLMFTNSILNPVRIFVGEVCISNEFNLATTAEKVRAYMAAHPVEK